MNEFFCIGRSILSITPVTRPTKSKRHFTSSSYWVPPPYLPLGWFIRRDPDLDYADAVMMDWREISKAFCLGFFPLRCHDSKFRFSCITPFSLFLENSLCQFSVMNEFDGGMDGKGGGVYLI